MQSDWRYSSVISQQEISAEGRSSIVGQSCSLCPGSKHTNLIKSCKSWGALGILGL
jgi:hypothetical protein